VLTILKTVVAQIDVLETMTPRQFQTIRRSDRGAPFASTWQRLLDAAG
jgi:tryptophan 2,3-dioxygenase